VQSRDETAVSRPDASKRPSASATIRRSSAPSARMQNPSLRESNAMELCGNRQDCLIEEGGFDETPSDRVNGWFRSSRICPRPNCGSDSRQAAGIDSACVVFCWGGDIAYSSVQEGGRKTMRTTSSRPGNAGLRQGKSRSQEVFRRLPDAVLATENAQLVTQARRPLTIEGQIGPATRSAGRGGGRMCGQMATPHGENRNPGQLNSSRTEMFSQAQACHGDSVWRLGQRDPTE
jgi:hypothetical protein